MHIVVGLGNPGKKYENTRHNVGFMVVDALSKGSKWEFKKKFNAELCSLDTNMLLVKPQTFMNKSGEAVGALVKFYNNNRSVNENFYASSVSLAKKHSSKTNVIRRSQSEESKNFIDFAYRLWIIHDDVDLDFGRLHIKVGGGTAGHHGVESIAKQLGSSDFVRFRCGIGPSACRINVRDFVLQPFSKEEQPQKDQLVAKTVEAIEYALKHGIPSAMNQYNSL